jgi:anti-anti-sigma factor
MASASGAARLGSTESVTSRRFIAPRTLTQSAVRGLPMLQAASRPSHKIGDRTEVLTLNGKCDLATAFYAEQRIISALDAGTTEIIFDLRGVTSIGRSMLQVLFRALIRMGQNGRLVLVRPNAHVWALFEESGMDRAFPTFDDLEGAMTEAPVSGAR